MGGCQCGNGTARPPEPGCSGAGRARRRRPLRRHDLARRLPCRPGPALPSCAPAALRGAPGLAVTPGGPVHGGDGAVRHGGEAGAIRRPRERGLAGDALELLQQRLAAARVRGLLDAPSGRQLRNPRPASAADTVARVPSGTPTCLAACPAHPPPHPPQKRGKK
jgi:hypothetical protein